MVVPITVLIVDDDAGFRSAARRLLESAGLTVVAEAADGAAAREAFLEHRPDGALLDINLPDTTGIVLAAEFAAAMPGVRILLTSTDEYAVRASAPPFVPKVELVDRDLVPYFEH